MEVVHSFEKVLNKKIKIKYTKRRPGDSEKIYCSSSKIKQKLKWMPKFSLLDMCKHSIAVLQFMKVIILAGGLGSNFAIQKSPNQ